MDGGGAGWGVAGVPGLGGWGQRAAGVLGKGAESARGGAPSVVGI